MAVGVTPKHSTLLTAYDIFPRGIRAEAGINTAVSGPVVSPRLGRKLGTQVLDMGPRDRMLDLISYWLSELHQKEVRF